MFRDRMAVMPNYLLAYYVAGVVEVDASNLELAELAAIEEVRPLTLDETLTVTTLIVEEIPQHGDDPVA
jgi:hypothetical protein